PPSSGPYSITNQQPITFLPNPTGYMNKKLPNAGNGGPISHLAVAGSVYPTNSDTMIKNQMSAPFASAGDRGVEVSIGWNQDKFGSNQAHNFYYGNASDPVYIVTACSSSACVGKNMPFHAPNGALLKGAGVAGSDHGMN